MTSFHAVSPESCLTAWIYSTKSTLEFECAASLKKSDYYYENDEWEEDKRMASFRNSCHIKMIASFDEMRQQIVNGTRWILN